MTQQEKDEFNRRHNEGLAKGRKTKVILAVVIPVVGIILTVLIGFAQKSKASDLASATVLDSQSISEFLNENPDGSAIYTGTISAVRPVSVRGEDGEYIMISRKIERETKEYDEESQKYVRDTQTISDDSDHCDEIEIDDITLPYSKFSDLPRSSDTYSDGADSNKIKTTYSYIPASIDGTFFLKCKGGDVDSAEYYASRDVAGESQKGFGAATAFMWLAIIVIEIVLIVKIISVSKILKGNR